MGIAQDVFNAVFTYYVVFVLMQSATVASSLMGTMAIMQFIAVIGMIPLCIRFGPRLHIAWWWCCSALAPCLMAYCITQA
ncbi:Uncharacterised protein [Hafnia alvei]|uniref:Uncharacterized protein n=1 Tax=Hafnia alvei TaxID=569 RepID=A0A377PLL1_HAFAL|nr:Uncharacterised protein [Hafnia alvei]